MVTIKLSDEDFGLLKLCMSSYEYRLVRHVHLDPDCPEKVKEYHLNVRDLYYKLLLIK